MANVGSWLRRVAVGALWALIAWFAVTIGMVVLLRWYAPPTSAVMLLEPGPVSQIDYRWADRGKIGRAAAQAVIAAEDQRFLEHYGFDLDSIGDALATYRAGGELRGASTITQQVAKNLFLWNGRSLVRKGLEAYFTVLLELLWPKQRILEVYLNVAEFGPGVFGVEAAAERFFGVHASDLGPERAALLAAVLPNPQRLQAWDPSAYVRMRRGEIIEQMRLLDQRGHYVGLTW
jgi:monofunctional biosynthetic peptidoglycan transglycosylase